MAKKKKQSLKPSMTLVEDVDALIAGEELSEEFRDRAVTIFEAAVTF